MELTRIVANISILLGFSAAVAVGIMGGIDTALMFPNFKPIGLLMGVSNCFVNAVTYFYVVKGSAQRKPSQPQELNIAREHTFFSSLFLLIAIPVIATTFIANFAGMYIGFTVLGHKLGLELPLLFWQVIGSGFGIASCVSGAVFNLKVGYSLWNKLKIEQPQTDLERLPFVRYQVEREEAEPAQPHEVRLTRQPELFQPLFQAPHRNNASLPQYLNNQAGFAAKRQGNLVLPGARIEQLEENAIVIRRRTYSM